MSDIDVVDGSTGLLIEMEMEIPHEVRLKVEFRGRLWLSVGGVVGEGLTAKLLRKWGFGGDGGLLTA